MSSTITDVMLHIATYCLPIFKHCVAPDTELETGTSVPSLQVTWYTPLIKCSLSVEQVTVTSVPCCTGKVGSVFTFGSLDMASSQSDVKSNFYV